MELVCVQLKIECTITYTGKNATLLIHEATLEDGMEKEAIEKTHRWGVFCGLSTVRKVKAFSWAQTSDLMVKGPRLWCAQSSSALRLACC